jgi:site-specific DNA-methyltransferase (adenine-specific)
MSAPRNRILCGDVRELSAELPGAIADCVVTSPPYYGHRAYSGDARELGREPTPQAYVSRLVDCLGAVRRLLKPQGTLWLNLGRQLPGRAPARHSVARRAGARGRRLDPALGHRLAQAQRDAPSGPHAPDSRSRVRLPALAGGVLPLRRGRDPRAARHVQRGQPDARRPAAPRRPRRDAEQGKNRGNGNLHDGRWDQAFHPAGRNKRTVWSVPLGKFREAHFAVFPEALIEPCVLAGCPEGGLVLDPFMGAGTTALVARRLGRDFLGFELVAEYVALAERRLAA